MAQAGPSRLSGGGGGSRGAGEAPGGGPAPLIRLRSKAPLPLFTCPHPIPSASSTIGDSLKLSVLRLLTGEVNERSSTAPMTESELLKLRTIHGWRMEMIALELRQNVLIAPETRDKIGEGVEDEMEGFELVDDADCGLLEADDEVLIRLKPAFSISDLHLPKLSSNHHYALPAGALTRAGTLSSPPPYSQVNVKRAAEPSSHSSSVQGQPNANFHARQWRDYSKGPRAVIAGAVTAPTAAETKEAKKARATSNPALNGPSRPLGLGMGVEPPAAVPSATTYKAPPLKQRRSKTNTADQGPSSQAPQSSMVPLISPPASAASAAPPPPLPPAPQRKASESKSRPVTGGSGQDKVASVSSPPPSATASNFGLASATTPTTATTANTAASSSAAGQESMPLTALVIGPGVQGAVGRGTSSAAMGHSGPAQVNGSTSVPDDYGNAKAFASFTAAGGEVQHRAKPRRQSSSHSQSTAAQRKMSQHSRTRSQEVAGVADDGEAGEPARAAVEAAQRRAAAARAAATAMSSTGGEPTPLSTSPEPSTTAQRLNGDHSEAAAAAPPAPVPKTRPSGKERKSSSKRERVELPEPPVLPPITNLAPFPEDQPQQQRETLPPMPTPADVGKGVPALRRKQSSKSGEDGSGLAAPARRPTLDGRVSSTTSGAVRTGESTPTTSRSNSPVVTRRPSYNVRQASTGAESNGSAGGTASRLARLAAPGLGLGGFGRKKSSTKGSATPKTTGNDDAATNGADGDADGLNTSEPTTPAEQPASNSNGGLATTPDEPAFTPPATSTSTSSAPLSRAERRYLDFQKSQQAEMSRQHAAERDRLAAMEKERREKQERAKKREEEERQRKHKEKDEVWQEVRRRAAAEKEKERERAAAAVGMSRKHSSGVVAAATAGAGGGADGGHDGGGHGGGGHDGGGGGGS